MSMLKISKGSIEHLYTVYWAVVFGKQHVFHFYHFRPFWKYWKYIGFV